VGRVRRRRGCGRGRAVGGSYAPSHSRPSRIPAQPPAQPLAHSSHAHPNQPARSSPLPNRPTHLPTTQNSLHHHRHPDHSCHNTTTAHTHLPSRHSFGVSFERSLWPFSMPLIMWWIHLRKFKESFAHLVAHLRSPTKTPTTMTPPLPSLARFCPNL